MHAVPTAALAAAVTLAVALAPTPAAASWEYRLWNKTANATATNEGLLQVRASSTATWGTVCDDSFDMNDARVACRSLGHGNISYTGYRTATSAEYGDSSTPILMDDLYCTGTEGELANCSRSSSHNCGHYEDVYIMCYATNPYSYRLVQAPNEQPGFGRFEASTNNGSSWNRVCYYSFDVYDARVACRSLGYNDTTHAAAFQCSSYDSTMCGLSTQSTSFGNMYCSGTETSLDQCNHYSTTCSNSYSTLVRCTAPQCPISAGGAAPVAEPNCLCEQKRCACMGGTWTVLTSTTATCTPPAAGSVQCNSLTKCAYDFGMCAATQNTNYSNTYSCRTTYNTLYSALVSYQYTSAKASTDWTRHCARDACMYGANRTCGDRTGVTLGYSDMEYACIQAGTNITNVTCSCPPRKYASGSSFGSTCNCVCYSPYAGANCTECNSAQYFYANTSCIDCHPQGYTYFSNLILVDGARVTVPYELRPQCHQRYVAVTTGYSDSSYYTTYGVANYSMVDRGFPLTANCSAYSYSTSLYNTFYLHMRMNDTSKSSQRLGQAYCVVPMNLAPNANEASQRSRIPRRLHVHLATSNTAERSAAISVVIGAIRENATVTVSFFDAQNVSDYVTLRDVNHAAKVFSEHSSYQSSYYCSLFTHSGNVSAQNATANGTLTLGNIARNARAESVLIFGSLYSYCSFPADFNANQTLANIDVAYATTNTVPYTFASNRNQIGTSFTFSAYSFTFYHRYFRSFLFNGSVADPCNGRGTAYAASWTTSGFYCYCNWPYSGPTCNQCARSTDFFDNATGQCVSCTGTGNSYGSSTSQSFFVESGVSRFVSLPIDSRCLASRSVYYWGGSRSVYAPVTTFGFNLTLQCDEDSWFPHTTSLYLTTTPGTTSSGYYSSWTYIGRAACIPQMPFANAAPRRVHVHVQGTSDSTLAMSGAIVNALLTNGTRVTGTANWQTPENSGNETSSVLESKAMWLNALSGIAQYRSYLGSPTCGLFASGNLSLATILQQLNGTDMVIVIGAGGSSCSSIMTELAAVARTRAAIAWVANGAPSFIRFVTPVDYESYDAIAPVRTQLNALFALRTSGGATCGDTISMQRRVDAFSRELVSVPGACNITECCFDGVCSRFVDNTGVPGCYTPLLRANYSHRVNVTVKTENGATTRSTTTTVGASQYWRRGVYAYRWSRWSSRRVDGFWQMRPTYEDTIYAYRYSGSAECCRLVGITFDGRVAGAFSQNYSCFPSSQSRSYYWAGLRLTVERSAEDLFGAPLRTVAVQCGSQFPEDPLLVDGASDAVPSTVALVPIGAPGTATPTVSNSRRIEQYVGLLLNHTNSSTAVAGDAMLHVRLALEAAGLRSTIAPTRRPCGDFDIPNVAGFCEFAWSATAATAGPYLKSAGFTAIQSDWALTGAIRGDVVVYPAATAGGNGVIAVVHDTTAQDGLVGVIRHGVQVSAAQASITGGAVSATGPAPVLYRLVGVVQPHPLSGETLLPVPALKEVTADATAFCRAWHTDDAAVKQAYWADAIAHINGNYRCPALLDRFTRPRQLWSSPLYDLGVGFGVQCFEASPWWIRGRAWSEGTGVRCCYDTQLRYIPTWPSRVTFTDVNEWQWSRVNEGEAERICCGGATTSGGNRTDTEACQAYRARRPATLPTNAPFTAPMDWWPRRRRGGGWGDPHCSTYDGFDFECNFHGEAAWTACGDWKVHAVAEPVGTSGRATAITKFAVRSGNSTVVAQLVSGGSVADNSHFEVTLDGQQLTADASGSPMSVTFSNNSITVTDDNGNEMEAVFSANLITLSTAPAETCRGNTTGLCGNFNGNSTDDLVVGSGILSVNASSEEIYREFVVSQLITDQSATLFPSTANVTTNASYTPAFITADVLNNCPSVCGTNKACCFDASVGGAAFAAEFVAARTQLEQGNQGAISFNENFPPVFVQATNLITLGNTSGSAASAAFATFVASDADRVVSLDCSICSQAGITCARSGDNTTRMTLSVSGAQPTVAGNFNCTATDSKGANGFAVTTIVAAGTLGSTYTPPETSAPDTTVAPSVDSAAAPVATLALAALFAALATLMA